MSGSVVGGIVGGAVGLLVALALVLLVYKPLRRRMTAGTGFEEWRQSARTLPLRDRWVVRRANSRGRAVEERLAGPARDRAQVLRRVLDQQTNGPFSGRLRLLLLGVAPLNLLIAVPAVVVDASDWWGWFRIVIWGCLLPLWVLQPRMNRRAARKLERSERLNQEVLDRAAAREAGRMGA